MEPHGIPKILGKLTELLLLPAHTQADPRVQPEGDQPLQWLHGPGRPLAGSACAPIARTASEQSLKGGCGCLSPPVARVCCAWLPCGPDTPAGMTQLDKKMPAIVEIERSAPRDLVTEPGRALWSPLRRCTKRSPRNRQYTPGSCTGHTARQAGAMRGQAASGSLLCARNNRYTVCRLQELLVQQPAGACFALLGDLLIAHSFSLSLSLSLSSAHSTAGAQGASIGCPERMQGLMCRDVLARSGAQRPTAQDYSCLPLHTLLTIPISVQVLKSGQDTSALVAGAVPVVAS